MQALLSIPCKGGSLRVMPDGYLVRVSMTGQTLWQIPALSATIANVSQKIMASLEIRSPHGNHLIEWVSADNIPKLQQALAHAPNLQLPPAPVPESPRSAPYSPIEVAPLQSPALAPPIRPTLDIPCGANRLQITNGYLQMVKPFGSIVWSVLARQVTGIRSQKKFPALTVTIDTPGGSYTAEMVLSQDFEKLRVAIAAYQ